MHFFESKLLGSPLLPLAWLYGGVVRAHSALYRSGILKQQRVNALVVSVGNVTVGGTGKTPFTAWLARELANRGVNVGIVSRGYGRKSRGTVVVSNGKQILADVYESGDEPQLLALKTPGVPVIADEDRSRGCREAERHFDCTALLLDDAFQHHRLHRDVDIVLVNAQVGFGNAYLLPAGPLREPLRALRRASQIVLTHCHSLEQAPELVAQIRRRSSAPLSCADYTFTGLISPSGRRKSVDWLRGKRVVAVAGIANPHSFFQTLTRLEAVVTHTAAFVDHHWYTRRDVARVRRLVRETRAQAVVTTEKDLVRLTPLLGDDTHDWLALEAELLPNPTFRLNWNNLIEQWQEASQIASTG